MLDESLIVAIANDHRLTDKTEYESAQNILKDLAKDVPAEEATGFNPSGFLEVEDSSQDTKEESGKASTALTMPRSLTNAGDSSSAGQAALEPDQSWSIPQLTSFNNDTEEGKLQQLTAMFCDLKPYDIKYALTKNNGDFQPALDDLLNLQYLQATGQQSKGIDGFFTGDDETSHKPKRKKKGKGKGAGHVSKTGNLDENMLGEYFNEAKDQSNISYLAERFNLTIDEVAMVFYDQDGSMSGCAIELLDRRLTNDNTSEQADSSAISTTTLAKKYRHIPEKYLQCIILSTSGIEQFSDDLASLVNKEFMRRAKNNKLDISARLTPLPFDDIEGSSATSVSSSASNSRRALPILTSPAPTTSDLTQALQQTAAHHWQRREASTAAANMYRKGASNPLFRQAAVVYSERANDYSRAAHQATSTAADLLVNQQSRGNEVDLHGVYVQDGTRIARQKALNWWTNLGDSKAQKAKQIPLVIVTGVGKHSAGGVSPLRRAVAAALLQDGWKVEIGTGKFTIYGRV